MDSYQRPSGRNFGNEFRRFILSGSALSRLMIINTVLFLLVQIVNVFLYLSNSNPFAPGTSIPISSWWLGLHASIGGLLAKPWGIITYAFIHEGLWHILFNLVLLYFGAQIFMMLFSEKRLLWTYLLGGICGALFFMLSINLFPAFATISEFAVLIGASASVLAIFIAAATKSPKLEVNFFLIGRVKLVYIAIAFVAIDLLSIDDGNPGGHFAHLGGALWGFVSVKSKGLLSLLQHSFNNLLKRKSRPGPRLYDPVRERPLSNDEFNTRKREREQRIDAILDKLKEKGYAGLSKEEKEFLNSAGK